MINNLITSGLKEENTYKSCGREHLFENCNM